MSVDPTIVVMSPETAKLLSLPEIEFNMDGSPTPCPVPYALIVAAAKGDDLTFHYWPVDPQAREGTQ